MSNLFRCNKWSNSIVIPRIDLNTGKPITASNASEVGSVRFSLPRRVKKILISKLSVINATYDNAKSITCDFYIIGHKSDGTQKNLYGIGLTVEELNNIEMDLSSYDYADLYVSVVYPASLEVSEKLQINHVDLTLTDVILEF